MVIKESLVPMHMPRNFKYSCNMHNSSIYCLPHQHLLKMIWGPPTLKIFYMPKYSEIEGNITPTILESSPIYIHSKCSLFLVLLLETYVNFRFFLYSRKPYISFLVSYLLCPFYLLVGVNFMFPSHILYNREEPPQVFLHNVMGK